VRTSSSVGIDSDSPASNDLSTSYVRIGPHRA
jgi:hypothetical protein